MVFINLRWTKRINLFKLLLKVAYVWRINVFLISTLLVAYKLQTLIPKCCDYTQIFQISITVLFRFYESSYNNTLYIAILHDTQL